MFFLDNFVTIKCFKKSEYEEIYEEIVNMTDICILIYHLIKTSL